MIPNRDAAAAELLPKLAGADALLLVHLAFGSGDPLLKLVDAGLPTAIFSQPFSGHDWMYVPQWQKAGKRVILLASSDYADLRAGRGPAARAGPHAADARSSTSAARTARSPARSAGEGQGQRSAPS